MNAVITLLIVYFAWNFAVIFVFMADKFGEIRGKKRVPEKVLYIVVFCFGGLGALLAMRVLFAERENIKLSSTVAAAATVEFLIIVLICYFILN